MSPLDVVAPEDLELACQALFGGLNGLGAEPVEYRVRSGSDLPGSCSVITPLEHNAMVAEIGAISDRDHLGLKLRFLALQVRGVVDASPLVGLDNFTADDVARLASDIAALEDVLRKGGDRLRGMAP